MPEETIVSAIQRVKQADGSYAAVFPINSVNEVLYDVDKNKNLKQHLDDLDDTILRIMQEGSQDAVPKKQEVLTPYGQITTFRDVYSYMGPSTLDNGPLVLRTPLYPANEITFNMDLTLAANNTVKITQDTKRKIDSIASDNIEGKSKVITYAYSKLGTHLAITAARGNGASEVTNKQTKIYSIYQDTLTEVSYNTNVAYDLCAFSEDGTYFAGFYKISTADRNVVTVFRRNDEGNYIKQRELPISAATAPTVTFLKLIDPERTTTGDENRYLYIFVGRTAVAPNVYRFNTATTSSPALVSSGIDFGGSVVVDMDHSADGRIIACATSTGMKLFRHSTGTTFTSLSTTIITQALTKVRVNRGGTMVAVMRANSQNNVYEYPVTDTGLGALVLPVKDASVTMADFEYTHNDNMVFTFNGNETRLIYVTPDIDLYPADDILKGLIGDNGSNIVMSSYNDYGFIIKAVNTVEDNYPQIIPIRFFRGVQYSADDTRLSMIPHNDLAISANNKFVVLVEPATSVTPVHIYKNIDGRYSEVQISWLDSTSSRLFNHCAISEDGKYILCGANSLRCLYVDDGTGLYKEYNIYTGSTDSGGTSASIATIDGRVIACITRNGGYPQPLDITNPESVVTLTLTRSLLGMGGTMIPCANRLVYLLDNVLRELILTDNTVAGYNYAITDQCDGFVKFTQDGNCGVYRIPNGWMYLMYDHNGRIISNTSNGHTDSGHNLACISEDKNLLYTISNTAIKCFSINGNIGENTELSLIETITDDRLKNYRDLFIVDNTLYAVGNVYPYTQAFKLDVVSGVANITVEGTLRAGYDLNISNLKTVYDNSMLIKNVGVGYVDYSHERIGVFIDTETNQFSNTRLHVNKVSYYVALAAGGALEENLSNPDGEDAYYEFDVTYGIEEDSEIEWGTNAFKYKDITIEGSATLNGEKIVTLTKVPNVVITPSGWMAEESYAGTICKYRIKDYRINNDSIVNIDINDLASIDIANEVNMYGTTVEGDGFVDIFATSIPSGNIVATLNIYK